MRRAISWNFYLLAALLGLALQLQQPALMVSQQLCRHGL